MSMLWHIAQIALALIVLAEALNKLHRCDLFDGRQGWRPRVMGAVRMVTPWRWSRAKVIAVIKALGWALLSFAAAGELVSRPTLHGTCAIAGMAMLIVRSRLKEGAEE